MVVEFNGKCCDRWRKKEEAKRKKKVNLGVNIARDRPRSNSE